MLETIRQEYTAAEVPILAVSVDDDASSLTDFRDWWGIDIPLGVNSPGPDPSCWLVPYDDPNHYAHFYAMVPAPHDAGVALQIVTDREGRVAWTSREYDFEALMGVLAELAEQER